MSFWRRIKNLFTDSSGHSYRSKTSKRMYAAAKGGRLNADWITAGTSADSETYTSLRILRNRSRQQCRDNEYGKQALRIIKNNVVHTGIGLQGQVKELRSQINDPKINAQIEDAWKEWGKADNCDTGGKLSLNQIQRLVLSSVVQSGEVFVRLVFDRFGNSSVPIALEVIEADRVDETYNGRSQQGNEIRMGIEVDRWNRAVAYWMRENHPGDYQFVMAPGSKRKLFRIPANEIIHVFIKDDRPSQTRGIPWMHAGLQKLKDLSAYEYAEIVAARASSAIMGFRTTPDGDLSEDESGENIENLEAGTIKQLAPGETFVGFNPARPNTGMEAFSRLILRGVAAAIGVSYESLSKDYSQSNYSSSRLSLLEDKDHWKVLQVWLIEDFLQVVHDRWFDMAVLSGALSFSDYEFRKSRYLSPKWCCRGWNWIDPAKEIRATLDAIDGGLTTLTDEIAKQGGDFEEMFNRRAAELEVAKSLGLSFGGEQGKVQVEEEEK